MVAMPRRRATVDAIVLGLMFAGGLGAVVFAAVPVGPQRTEVERVLAPGGAHEAVVVSWDGGATTEVGHDVHVVAKGGAAGERNLVAAYHGAYREDDVRGVVCRWTSPTALSIDYERARRAECRRARIEVGATEVTVVP